MSVLELGPLVGTLHEHGVAYVVIGGVAVGAHGYVRATKDLDIVPDRTSENIKRLSDALVALEAAIPAKGGRRYEPERDEAPLHMGQSAVLDTRYGKLDIVQRIPGVLSWVELEEAAVEAELLGVPVRICSLEHLRRMKEAAGRERDRADLAELEDA